MKYSPLLKSGDTDLATLPGEPRGVMAQMFPGPVAPGEERAWRRVNASHLLGHLMVHHGERCDGCRDWG